MIKLLLSSLIIKNYKIKNIINFNLAIINLSYIYKLVNYAFSAQITKMRFRNYINIWYKNNIYNNQTYFISYNIVY